MISMLLLKHSFILLLYFVNFVQSCRMNLECTGQKDCCLYDDCCVQKVAYLKKKGVDANGTCENACDGGRVCCEAEHCCIRNPKLKDSQVKALKTAQFILIIVFSFCIIIVLLIAYIVKLRKRPRPPALCPRLDDVNQLESFINRELSNSRDPDIRNIMVTAFPGIDPRATSAQVLIFRPPRRPHSMHNLDTFVHPEPIRRSFSYTQNFPSTPPDPGGLPEELPPDYTMFDYNQSQPQQQRRRRVSLREQRRSDPDLPPDTPEPTSAPPTSDTSEPDKPDSEPDV